MTTISDMLDPIEKLRRDLKTAAVTLSTEEARYLVDAYYSVQDYRKAANEQVRSLSKAGEPHEVLGWLMNNMATLEKQVLRALDAWSDGVPIARWAKSICGIGPVIASGLAAHIDIEKAPTAGHIWSFAGLNPGKVWLPKTKRPWNARLKVLAWKVGESFVKVSGNPSDVYGKMYIERKAEEWKRNLAGELAEQAKGKTEVMKRDTSAKMWYTGRIDPKVAAEWLEKGKSWLEIPVADKAEFHGMLPPAHIHARACRWTVKMFLSHYHYVAYSLKYGKEPPRPYAIEHMGHAHMVEAPNWPMEHYPAQ
jgi:hypothetical protein